MDTNKYKELFISESREMLDALNKLVVSLEKDPANPEVLNEIFRYAHTLKGMAATMGYEDMTGLSHAMEDLLGQLRNKRLSADRRVVDLMFQALDGLAAMLELDEHGDLPPVVFSIRQMMDDMPHEPADQKPKVMDPKEKRTNLRLNEPDREEIIKLAGENVPAFRVAVTLKKDCPLKEARVMVVVKELEEAGKVIRAEFIHRQIEGGKYGRHFGLFYITKENLEDIKKKILDIPDVENIEFRLLGADEVVVKKPSVKPEKESAPKHEVQSVRVSLDKLDNLMNTVGELVINKIRLKNLAQDFMTKPLEESLSQLDRIADNMQNYMMDIRLVPMDYIFNRFPRMVRDLAKGEGKDVELVILGADIGLDRSILDELNEPLVHLLRNAVHHGIEPSAVREKGGKKTAGVIKLSARRERNFVIVEVEDDGGGISPEVVKKIAVEKGFLSSADASKLNDEEILMLITTPGFSTSNVVTQTSGRGVGMNSVRTKIESFGGTLAIESGLNKGSKFTLKLPLSMAIIQALMVELGDKEIYAIPLVNIMEVIKIRADEIKKIEHREVISYRDTVLPLVRLGEKLGFSEIRTDRRPVVSPVVVVEVGARRAGLIVEKLVRQQEVVIKTVKGSLKGIKGIAGATILGDGRVAMIADVAAVI